MFLYEVSFYDASYTFFDSPHRTEFSVGGTETEAIEKVKSTQDKNCKNFSAQKIDGIMGYEIKVERADEISDGKKSKEQKLKHCIPVKDPGNCANCEFRDMINCHVAKNSNSFYGMEVTAHVMNGTKHPKCPIVEVNLVDGIKVAKDTLTQVKGIFSSVMKEEDTKEPVTEFKRKAHYRTGPDGQRHKVKETRVVRGPKESK